MQYRRVLWLAVVVSVSAGVVGMSPSAVAGQSDTATSTRTPDVMFVPTPPEVVDAMLRVAKVGKRDTVYDLGSGDGRIPIAAVQKYGAARGLGIDIDPVRIEEAVANAKKAGVTKRVEFRQGDLFELDVSPATVVTLYLLNSLNLKLRPTLLKDLRPGTRVVSHAFNMDEWEPDSAFTVEGANVYYWVIPADVAGTWQWSLPGASDDRRYALALTQKFQKVNGSMATGGGNPVLSEVRLKGDSLSFTLTDTTGGERVVSRYTGRVDGNEINGRVVIEGGPLAGRHTWRATREDQN